MSNISNIHSVVPYVSGKTKPLEGQRLAKVTYKVDKETGIKPDSKAVSIPVITFDQIEPHIASIKGEIVGLVHTAQDKLVRKFVEEGSKEIAGERINLQAVLAYMLEETKRLDGDTIRAWFSDNLHEPLMLAFAIKMGIGEDQAPTPDQEKKLASILKGYEDSFAKMASGAASFNDVQRDRMLKALSLIDEDPIKARFIARLDKKEEDLLADF